MKSRFIQIACIVILPQLLAACSDDNVNEPILPDEPVAPERAYIEVTTSSSIEMDQTEIDANTAFNDFGLRLFDLICKDKTGENITISPLSASIAIAMMANTGDDEFARNIYNAIGSKDLSVLNSVCRKLMMFLPDSTHKCDISIANALWHSPSLKPTDAFTELLGQNYFADVNALDFRDQHAADTINRWVDLKTNGMIKDFLSGKLIEQADVCGVNAVYFNGSWAKKFSKDNTYTGLFNGASRTSEVKFMSMSTFLPYSRNDKGEWIYLPYSANDYVFIAALPAEGYTVSDFVKSFNVSYLNLYDRNSWKESIDHELPLINLSLPKFESEFSLYLENYFRQLDILLKTHGLPGMTSISKNETEQSFAIKQKTVIKVDEDGSSASSATGVLYPSSSGDDFEPKVVDLTFDRPFVYFICNTKTGSILIAGVISQL